MPPVRSRFVVLTTLALVAPASAQIADHLKCYKAKDSRAKATYTADLGGLVAGPGCIISLENLLHRGR